jgi:hypothetical protein
MSFLLQQFRNICTNKPSKIKHFLIEVTSNNNNCKFNKIFSRNPLFHFLEPPEFQGTIFSICRTTDSRAAGNISISTEWNCIQLFITDQTKATADPRKQITALRNMMAYVKTDKCTPAFPRNLLLLRLRKQLPSNRFPGTATFIVTSMRTSNLSDNESSLDHINYMQQVSRKFSIL